MNGKKLFANLNLELEGFLRSTDSAKYQKIIRKHLYLKFLLKQLRVPLVFAAVLCAFYYVPLLNWSGSAVGRIILIKWVLPVYNWQAWTSARCLIEAPSSSYEDREVIPDSVYADDCAMCENLCKLFMVRFIQLFRKCVSISVKIDRRENISFVELERGFLRRSIPLIVTNSHLPWRQMIPGMDFIEFLNSLPDLKASKPCNVLSNLLSNPRSAEQLLKQLEYLQQDEKWFFHFRNCDFDAIKASRAIIPFEARPQYLSQHLPPFRSSWILASRNYDMKAAKRLNLRRLAVVVQLSGELTGTLGPHEVCAESCNELRYHLAEGEALIFSSEMWSFSYRSHNEAEENYLIATLIQEIEN